MEANGRFPLPGARSSCRPATGGGRCHACSGTGRASTAPCAPVSAGVPTCLFVGLRASGPSVVCLNGSSLLRSVPDERFASSTAGHGVNCASIHRSPYATRTSGTGPGQYCSVVEEGNDVCPRGGSLRAHTGWAHTSSTVCLLICCSSVLMYFCTTTD